MKIIYCLFALALFGCATVISEPPLPDNVRIVVPQNTPADFVAFSGKWVGKWDIGRDSKLVVEEIDYPKVIAIYSVGPYRADSSDKGLPGWNRYKGEISNGSLILKTTSGGTITYKLQPDGTLAGNYERGSFFSRISMTRVIQ